jgi:hypothetical protein
MRQEKEKHALDVVSVNLENAEDTDSVISNRRPNNTRGADRSDPGPVLGHRYDISRVFKLLRMIIRRIIS